MINASVPNDGHGSDMSTMAGTERGVDCLDVVACEDGGLWIGGDR